MHAQVPNPTPRGAQQHTEQPCGSSERGAPLCPGLLLSLPAGPADVNQEITRAKGYLIAPVPLYTASVTLIDSFPTQACLARSLLLTK